MRQEHALPAGTFFGNLKANAANAKSLIYSFIYLQNLEFNVMPYVLSNAPATFEMMTDTVLRYFPWRIGLCYLNDIVVYSTMCSELARPSF